MAAVLPGVPCDYNGDGVCDAADYVVWRNNLGTNNVILNDPTPGNVDQSDYDFWRTRFGNTAGSGAAVTVTPEPSTFFLAITALATLSTRRRKPNSQANPRW